MNNYIGQEAAAELYENLLTDDAVYLESLKEGARRAGEGLKTDIQLWSVDNDGNHSTFPLYLPKYAVSAVTARTGGGKTTLLSNMAVRFATNGKTGLYVTLEEADFAINAKMLAAYSSYTNRQYSANRLTTGDAFKVISGEKQHEDMAGYREKVMSRCRVIDANKQFDKDNIASPTLLYQVQYIADLLEFVKSDGTQLDFVIIDFGQLLEGSEPTESSYQRMKSVMQGLKNLAGTGIAVCIGAQLKREVASEWLFDIQPESIRDGSDVEQACSMILCVGRDTKQKDIDQRDVIRLLKNRNGRKRVGGMLTIDFEHNYIPTLTEQPTEKAL